MPELPPNNPLSIAAQNLLEQKERRTTQRPPPYSPKNQILTIKPSEPSSIYTFEERLTTTIDPLAPGIAPLTKRTFFSGSTLTTSKFFTVTLTAPI